MSNVTHFLAAQSSSRSLVVCLSVACETFVKTFAKKSLLEYQMVTKPYLHSYLCYSSDNSDRSDSSEHIFFLPTFFSPIFCDQNFFFHTYFLHQQIFLTKSIFIIFLITDPPQNSFTTLSNRQMGHWDYVTDSPQRAQSVKN